MSRKSTLIAIVALISATAFWAGNYVIGEAAVAEIDPTSLVALRWALAALPLILLAWVIERPDWRAAIRTWPWILALALTGLLGFNMLLYSALQHTTAVSAALITAFNPALITLAAAVFLRDRLTPFGIGGVALALIGVLIVLGNGDPLALFGTGFGIGELHVIGAIIVWTAYTIIGRKAPHVPPITSTALQAVIAAIITAALAAITGGIHLPTTTSATWALIYIALCPSVLSYLLWNSALRVIPPSRAGVFLNLITVFTVLIALLLGSSVTPAGLLGGAVILGGIALTYVSPARFAQNQGSSSVEDRVPDSRH